MLVLLLGPHCSKNKRNALWIYLRSVEIKLVFWFSRRTLANYIAWQMLFEMMPYMPKSFEIYENTTESRQEFCSYQTDRFLGLATAAMFVRKNFAAADRSNVSRRRWKSYGPDACCIKFNTLVDSKYRRCSRYRQGLQRVSAYRWALRVLFLAVIR